LTAVLNSPLKLDLIVYNRRIEVFSRNSAVKMAIRLDRRERAKARLARMKAAKTR
jgi:hypothetical protein